MAIDQINLVVGIGIILINLIPFILKKPRLLLLTSAVSLFVILLLIFLG
jgi:hypothetical protein